MKRRIILFIILFISIGIFVAFQPPTLPRCDSKSAAWLLSDLKNSMEKQFKDQNQKIQDIKILEQRPFDSKKKQRACEIELVTNKGSRKMTFILSWLDEEKKQIVWHGTFPQEPSIFDWVNSTQN